MPAALVSVPSSMPIDRKPKRAVASMSSADTSTELHARVAQEERVIQGGQEVEVESDDGIEGHVAADLGIRMELQVGQAAGQVGTGPRALSAWNRVSVSCSR